MTRAQRKDSGLDRRMDERKGGVGQDEETLSSELVQSARQRELLSGPGLSLPWLVCSVIPALSFK